MKKILQIFSIFCCLFLSVTTVNSQTIVQDTLTRVAPISYELRGNQAEFGLQMPPLKQTPGAPKAYYTYYWEFGDGDFSFEENPKHTYQKDGEYIARLWSTNNYDNGKPPTSRPEKITVDSQLDQASANTDFNKTAEPSVFPDNEHLVVKSNRDPLPNEELVLITSYKNTKDYVTNGELYLYYNDKKFKDDNFRIKDTRMHRGETINEAAPSYVNVSDVDASPYFMANSKNQPSAIYRRIEQDSTERLNLPATFAECNELYRDHQRIEFKNMQPGEERHIFRTLETTPEMLKDTSAIVTLRTVYVPDKNYSAHTVKDTELEIVTSHDPNKMSSNGTILNYRLVRFKRVQFKVKFQNNGEGPANTIRLEVDTPEMFDKGTLEITDMYPKCPICPEGREVNYACLDTIKKKDKLIFTFKKIYLPGTAQKNVVDRDSTKGFVKYSMKFGNDFHKEKTTSRTAIYFDKNEPIITNYSTTRFLPGLSIGAKAGCIFTPSRDNSQEYFAGVTVSPFKSYRGYLQAEFSLSAGSFDELKQFEKIGNENAVGIESLMRLAEKRKENNITAYLVPVSYRYNLNNFIAVGGGVQLQLDLQNKVKTTTKGEAFLDIPGEGTIRDEVNDTYQKTECTHSFTNFNAGVFADVNFGGVRIGPSLGLRYVLNVKAPTSQIQAYAIWKF